MVNEQFSSVYKDDNNKKKTKPNISLDLLSQVRIIQTFNSKLSFDKLQRKRKLNGFVSRIRYAQDTLLVIVLYIINTTSIH